MSAGFAPRIRGFEVDSQIELSRLLDRDASATICWRRHLMNAMERGERPRPSGSRYPAFSDFCNKICREETSRRLFGR
jgi:hypothetical protein